MEEEREEGREREGEFMPGFCGFYAIWKIPEEIWYTVWNCFILIYFIEKELDGRFTSHMEIDAT